VITDRSLSGPPLAPDSALSSPSPLQRIRKGVAALVSGHRFSLLVVLGVFFLLVAFLLRLGLTILAWGELDHGASLALDFVAGFFFDLCALSWVLLPLAFYLLVLPQRIFAARWHQWLSRVFVFGFIYLILFGAVSEWFFWLEFGVRYNFIAVDYLIYTTEVVGNINESYPMPLILSVIAGVSAGVFFFIARMGWLGAWFGTNSATVSRCKTFGLVAIAPAIVWFAGKQSMLDSVENAYNQELGKNGLMAFFDAYQASELDYERFYQAMDSSGALAVVREQVLEPGGTFLSGEPEHLERMITGTGPEHRLNVIFITVESLSGRFLGAWGEGLNLTPNLDRLAGEGLFLRKLFATGNRTIRGMEALMLSVPPTPGCSILKRPENKGLFTMATPFQNRGYDTAFVYGGHGMFDNMNDFFGGNGLRIVDRGTALSDEVTFETVWGACDEDLFHWSGREADAMHAAGKPFFQFVMTTSNHRPYTYPDGKVAIPSGKNREGAVQYTDYAIGQFIEEARVRPWFDDTVFVIVADHCASSAGKVSLPVRNYEIPCIIYAPKWVKARQVDALCSQIDIAPTLLGLLDWTYPTKFFGRDILRSEGLEGRAFLGTYQMLGYLTGDEVTVLAPGRKVEQYRLSNTGHSQKPVEVNPAMRDIAIAFYQSASQLFGAGRLTNDIHDASPAPREAKTETKP
jgi:phosphoglycerol transferase MdoB-like AlkP superfamily enzyme